MYVPAVPYQNRAMSDCSAVRVVLPAAPRLLTSSKAAVYSALVKSGGGGGRNSESLGMQNGMTCPHCGATAGAKAGGVGCQSPGSVPGT